MAAVGAVAALYVPGRPWDVSIPRLGPAGIKARKSGSRWIMTGPPLDGHKLYEEIRPVLRWVSLQSLEALSAQGHARNEVRHD